jgi:Ca-activated chloride channel family protein
MIHFESLYALLLLLVLPLLAWRRWRRPRAAIGFPSTDHARLTGTSWRRALVGLPHALRLLALALLIIALARPQFGTERVRDVSQGIAIALVVDRSGSMAEETRFAGETLERLEVVKRVVNQFVHGDGKSLKGRRNDLVGLISFALYPDTLCPPTLGHDALSRFVETLRIVPQRSPENRTSIGDALALAGARLASAEQDLAKQTGKEKEGYKIKGKVIILLTDGNNNAGELTPSQALPLLKEWGIRLYAVGIGDAPPPRRPESGIDAFFLAARGQSQIDMALLHSLADETGGKAYLATDGDSLKRIYEEIDQLESSEIEADRYVDYREIFAFFAVPALAILALEILLSCTIFRKIP